MVTHLKDITSPCLTHSANRSVDNADSMRPNYILQHLDLPGTMPGFSLKTLAPCSTPSFKTHPADCASRELSEDHKPPDRQEAAETRLVNITSSKISNVLRFVLCPLLFPIRTKDCTSRYQSVNLLRFADDAAVISLIWAQRRMYFLFQLWNFFF